MENFTTFEGRIGRYDFWVGILVLFLAVMVLGFASNFIFGGGFLARLLQFIVTLAMTYFYAAIATKRLHDRNKPQMPLLAIFIGPSLLLNVMHTFGIGFVQSTVALGAEAGPGAVVSVPNALGSIVMFASGVTGIWALVALGILKGTEGPNDYGPDPVA